jgi:hypothetical protein
VVRIISTKWWVARRPKQTGLDAHLVGIPESVPRSIHRRGGVAPGHSPLKLPGGQHRARNCAGRGVLIRPDG